MLYILLILFIYYSYRYAWWKKAVNYNYPRILMYHMITEHKKGVKFNGLRVSPDNFEKQIKYLKDNNWHSVTMNELIENRKTLNYKTVAITFDDGYEDNLINALPILQKYNFKATIYLVNDRDNRDWSINRKKKNNSGELKKEKKLTDKQVQELLDSGIIEIGAHTLTHPNFKNLTIEETEQEIKESKLDIEKKFNIKCSSFAYPFGIYKENDDIIAKKDNFKSAVTTNNGIQNLLNINLFLLDRITISGKDNFLAFKLKLKTGKRGVRK